MNKRKRKKLDKKRQKEQELFGKRLLAVFNSIHHLFPRVLPGEKITINHDVLSNMRYLYPIVFINRYDATTGEWKVVEIKKQEEDERGEKQQ